MYQRCAGIDVHLRFLVVCLSIIEAGQRRKEIRTFRNETADLLALRAWLLQEKCSHVGMESTGVYWLQVSRRLEGFFELAVANAQHLKAVPGRKTDVQDAEWIADLLQHGLLTASFVPSQEPQDVRDLTRLRVSLVQERARLVNRVHKVLARGRTQIVQRAQRCDGLVRTCYPRRAVCRRKRPAALGEVDASKRTCNPGASGSRSGRRGPRAPSLPLARTAPAH